MTKGEGEQTSVPYNESLLNIVRGKALYSGNFDQAFHEITETAANTLGVERTSIWLFADNGKKSVVWTSMSMGHTAIRRG